MLIELINAAFINVAWTKELQRRVREKFNYKEHQMIDIENEIKDQVKARIKHLLFDANVIQYRGYETFKSNINQSYQFLIWKLQPESPEKFGNEIQDLVENKGHHCIPGAWDVSTYKPDKKTGYKVVALYKPK